MGLETATADGRVRAMHPRIAAAGMVGLLLFVGVVLTSRRLAHHWTTAAARSERPIPPAVHQRFLELAQILRASGETPTLTETCSGFPVCTAELTTADRVIGRFVVDRITARFRYLSCQSSYCTTRLREQCQPVHTPKEAEAVARIYLESFFPEETRSAVVTEVSGTPTAAWHLTLSLRSENFYVTLDAQTGTLVLLTRCLKGQGFR